MPRPLTPGTVSGPARPGKTAKAEGKGRKGRNMPFVYDESEIEWTDEDTEPLAPHPSQFQYIPPPMFGGASEPVRFVVPSLDDLSGPRMPAVFNGGYSGNAVHDEYMQQLIAVIVPAMRDHGVRRVYCRYDGGHDEGFAWLESVEMEDGSRVNADAFIERLTDGRLQDAIGEVRTMPGGVTMSDLQENIRRELADEWATMLLGRGYGTGEYSMYGAFTVDLVACTIVDDPNAKPESEAIDMNMDE